MKRPVLTLGLAALTFLALASPASATNFSYSSLSISVNGLSFNDHVQVGNVRFSGMNGMALAGSYQFSDNFFASLGGSFLENSGFGNEISLGTGALSLGAAFAVADSTDLVVQIGLANAEVEACISGFCAKEDNSGILLAAGLRHMVSRNVEINVGLDYVSLSNYDGQLSIGAGAAWWANDSSSLFLNLGVDDDSNTSAAIGYRYTFIWSR